MKNIIEVLGLFIIFGSILFLAYVTTRFIGAKSKKAARGKYINIVDTVSLGMDKQLHLVRVDKQFVLIATSGKNVELLMRLKIEDFDAAQYDNPEGLEFKSFFERYARFYKDLRPKKDAGTDGEEKPALNKEAYSIKRNLEKLKSINNGAYIKGGKDGNDYTDEK